MEVGKDCLYIRQQLEVFKNVQFRFEKIGTFVILAFSFWWRILYICVCVCVSVYVCMCVR